MVPPWIGYSIWKFWVIYVLVFLVFQVFSIAELISLAKTVNLAVWAFSLNFLHEFTWYVIDMHNIYHISSISTTFGPLWNVGFPGQDPNLHLALCHNLFLTKLITNKRRPFGNSVKDLGKSMFKERDSIAIDCIRMQILSFHFFTS